MERLYRDFNVTLKIGKEEIIIIYGSRIIQGNNLPPALFIIFMYLVTEDILNHLNINKMCAI